MVLEAARCCAPSLKNCALLNCDRGLVDTFNSMVRGWYTAASGMLAQQRRLDALSNNLANVNTTGYKRDLSINKAFPEILLRRFSDDGVRVIPHSDGRWGSVDTAPVVGRLGTGVEQNEIYTVFEQGSLRQTENVFDVALEGEGFFVVETPNGERYTRNGSFHLGPESVLVTKEGFPVLGENGRIQVKLNNFYVDGDGSVYVNNDFQDDPFRLVSRRENEWRAEDLLDRLQVVQVPRRRYLQKQGSSLWRATEDSGEASIQQARRVRQGFLETANVNPVSEMVRMIEVNRAYEANQRVIQAQDESTVQLLRQVLRS